MMKLKLFLISIIAVLFCACHYSGNISDSKRAALENEIVAVEKSFEKMCAEKGVAEAFAFFASEKAVIKRGNDSLIYGVEGIRNFYANPKYKNVTVTWAPTKVEVASANDMAYSFGKYEWVAKNAKGEEKRYNGVYTTIWRKQPDGLWKYVWD